MAADTPAWNIPESNRQSVELNRTVAEAFGNNPGLHDTPAGRMLQDVYHGQIGDYSTFASAWNNSGGVFSQGDNGRFNFDQAFKNFGLDVSVPRAASFDSARPVADRAAAPVQDTTAADKQKAYETASNVLANRNTTASQKLHVLDQLAQLGENNVSIRDRDGKPHPYRIERNDVGDGRAQVSFYRRGEDGAETRILSGVSDGQGHFDPERGPDGRFMSWRGPNQHALLRNSELAEHDASEESSQSRPGHRGQRQHDDHPGRGRRHHGRRSAQRNEQVEGRRDDAGPDAETEQLPASRRVQIGPAQDNDRTASAPRPTQTREDPRFLSDIFGTVNTNKPSFETPTRPARPEDASKEEAALARARESARQRGADQPDERDYGKDDWWKEHLTPMEKASATVNNPVQFMDAFHGNTDKVAHQLGYHSRGRCAEGPRKGLNNTDPDNFHIIGDPNNVTLWRTATQLGQALQNAGWVAVPLNRMTEEQRKNMPTALVVRPWSSNPNGAGHIEAVKAGSQWAVSDFGHKFDYENGRYMGSYALFPANHPFAIQWGERSSDLARNS